MNTRMVKVTELEQLLRKRKTLFFLLLRKMRHAFSPCCISWPNRFDQQKTPSKEGVFVGKHHLS